MERSKQGVHHNLVSRQRRTQQRYAHATPRAVSLPFLHLAPAHILPIAYPTPCACVGNPAYVAPQVQYAIQPSPKKEGCFYPEHSVIFQTRRESSVLRFLLGMYILSSRLYGEHLYPVSHEYDGETRNGESARRKWEIGGSVSGGISKWRQGEGVWVALLANFPLRVFFTCHFRRIVLYAHQRAFSHFTARTKFLDPPLTH